MKLSKQITDRIEDLAQTEAEAAFYDYCHQATARAERISGQSIDNFEAVKPLLRQAFDKGIAATRLGELMAQSM